MPIDKRGVATELEANVETIEAYLEDASGIVERYQDAFERLDASRYAGRLHDSARRDEPSSRVPGLSGNEAPARLPVTSLSTSSETRPRALTNDSRTPEASMIEGSYPGAAVERPVPGKSSAMHR